MNGYPLLDKITSLLDRNVPPGLSEGKEQDMYALGLTIFFALTGVNLKTLPS